MDNLDFLNRGVEFRAFPKRSAFANEEDYKEYAEMLYTEDADLKRGSGFVAPNDPGYANEDLHWMQWTGLYDKKGVKIYEGDIVTGENYMFPCYDNRQLTVFWSKEEQCFSTRIMNHADIEVIGNIFENPELK